ncbi:MAG TPA: tetratricopeptide repeat protein [Nitrososphaeraceae archaeon]|nr:tetratricopeptide repeat protein [Nitrososphaeraceae archaeon]
MDISASSEALNELFKQYDDKRISLENFGAKLREKLSMLFNSEQIVGEQRSIIRKLLVSIDTSFDEYLTLKKREATSTVSVDELDEAKFKLNESIGFCRESLAEFFRRQTSLNSPKSRDEQHLQKDELQTDKSLEELENTIRENPDDAKAYNSLGNYYFRKEQNYNKAIEQYKKAIEKDASNYIFYINIGDSFSELGDYQQARDWYKKALEVRPNDALTLNALANVQSMIGEYDDAIENYTKSLKIEPTATVYVNLGDTYRIKDNIEEALVQYENALVFDKKSAFVYDAIGEAYLDLYYRSRTDDSLLHKAIDNSKQSLAIESNNAQTHAVIGKCYYLLRDNDKAIDHYKRAIDLDKDDYKNNATYSAHIGYMYNLKGDHETANEYYNKALDLDPDNPTVLKYIGDFNKQLGKFDQAAEYYEQYFQKYPTDTGSLRSLGEMYSKLNRDLSKIENYVKEVLNKNPNDYNSYLDVAYIYKLMGKFDNAITNLKKAAQINDKAASIKIGLGDMYTEKLNFVEAIKHFEAAAKLDPADPSVYAWLSVTYSRIRDWDKAMLNAELANSKARDIDPSNSTYLSYISRVHHDRGLDYYNRSQLQEAVEEYKKANEIKEDPVTYYNLYLAYRYSEPPLFKEAKEAIIKAIQLSPKLNPDYTNALANLQNLENTAEQENQNKQKGK